jgi:hypothetical protein
MIKGDLKVLGNDNDWKTLKIDNWIVVIRVKRKFHSGGEAAEF